MRSGEAELLAAGIQDPGWNAERLLIHTLSSDRAHLYANLQMELGWEQEEPYRRLIKRRAQHEPLAYIEGWQEFYGRRFFVDRSVLIPRPETEEIVRAVLELPLPPSPGILDIGAGSGCIAMTLALELPRSIVTALEYSNTAIAVLLKNANGKAGIVRGDLNAPAFLPGSFDVIVSNPPYVEESDYSALPAETLYEPRLALVPSSIESVYLSLLKAGSTLLRPGGRLVFEIGAGQDQRIEDLFSSVPNMIKIGSRNDFREILRTFILQKA